MNQEITRRNIAKAAAWSVPAVTATVATPAMAASDPCASIITAAYFKFTQPASDGFAYNAAPNQNPLLSDTFNRTDSASFSLALSAGSIIPTSCSYLANFSATIDGQSIAMSELGQPDSLIIQGSGTLSSSNFTPYAPLATSCPSGSCVITCTLPQLGWTIVLPTFIIPPDI
ncbi:MAG: hypothetical protein QM632_00195 [Micrococcaceae bacterium]